MTSPSERPVPGLVRFCFRLASAEHRHGNGDHDDDGNQDHDDGNRIADRIDVRACHRALFLR